MPRQLFFGVFLKKCLKEDCEGGCSCSSFMIMFLSMLLAPLASVSSAGLRPASVLHEHIALIDAHMVRGFFTRPRIQDGKLCCKAKGAVKMGGGFITT